MSELHWYQSDKDLWKYLRRHDRVIQLRRHRMFIQLGTGGYVHVMVRQHSPSWSKCVHLMDRIQLTAFSTGRVYIAMNNLFDAVAENFDQVIPIVVQFVGKFRSGEYRTPTRLTKLDEMPEGRNPKDDLLPFQAACRVARREKFLRQQAEYQAKLVPQSGPVAGTLKQIDQLREQPYDMVRHQISRAVDQMMAEIVREEDAKFLRAVNEALKDDDVT